MDELNQFNPSTFDFLTKKDDSKKLKEELIFSDGQKKFSLVIYILGFLLTSFFFVYSLIYVLRNPNLNYNEGGIGEFGHFSISLFFILVLALIVVSCVYRLKYHNINDKKMKRRKLVLTYIFAYSYILLFSSIALRKDICGNQLLGMWSHYGSFIIMLFTVLFTVLIFITKYINSDYALKNINFILIIVLSVFTIAHYPILHTSFLINPNNMWTIIIGTIFGLTSAILLFNSNKKSTYLIAVEITLYAALFFVVFGLIKYGCEMPVSIPHIVY